MFGKKSSTAMAVSSGSETTTLIAEGTEILGDVNFRGNMHVEGRIVGDIKSFDGTFRLVEGGVVEGDIQAPNVIINGAVKGDVRTSGKIELASKAEISGNVYYNLIEMVIGAQVNGSLEHVGPAVEKVEMLEDKTKKTVDEVIPALSN